MGRIATLIVVLLSLTGTILSPPAQAASVTHIYDLNGTLTDSLGGPSLVPAGGTLTATGYAFGANQGLGLAGGLLDGGSYSIELIFNFSNLNGDRRILDFKSTDTGLYTDFSALMFFISNVPNSQAIIGPSGAFVPGQDVHLVLTRDAISGTVVGYINGVQQISFTDAGGNAVFNDNLIHFFIDDTVEASAGVVDRIRIYDGALTGAQVTDLFNGARPPGLPGSEITSVGPARLWIGLRNSDDVGLRVDLRAELLVNGSTAADGSLRSVSSGSSGFGNAIFNTVPLSLPEGFTVLPDVELSLRVSIRRTCSGAGHNSGTVRFWYNGQPVDTGAARDAGSRFSVTVDGSVTNYLLRSGFDLETVAGSSRLFLDTTVDSKKPCPNRPFTEMGTWSIALP
jgi:Concanavalin A-like lectin/glucanases superfamily